MIEVPGYISGNALNPIVVEPESTGGVTLSENVKIEVFGSYIHIKGFSFYAIKGQSLLLGGHYNALEGNSIYNAGDSPTNTIIRIPKGSTHNSILNNDISQSLSMSVQVKSPYFGFFEPITKHNIIQANVFHDIDDSGTNGREAIQVGGNSAPYESLKTVIQNNRFERSNGDGEIISIKSHGNYILNNVFKDSDGELVIRSGHRSVVSGNKLINTQSGQSGIRASGTSMIITNNLFYSITSGYGLRLMRGCIDYFGVRDSMIAHNTFVTNGYPVKILSWSCGAVVKEVEDNVFVNNIFKIYSKASQQLFVAENIPIQTFFESNEFVNNIGDIYGNGPALLAIPASGVEVEDVDVVVDLSAESEFNPVTVNSPGRDAGVPGYADADISGKLRDQTPDIGAWEE